MVKIFKSNTSEVTRLKIYHTRSMVAKDGGFVVRHERTKVSTGRERLTNNSALIAIRQLSAA
jgi:hypothetical protein